MPDERFRIIFEGQERNLDQVLKKIEKAFDQISNANPFEKINAQMALMGKAMDEAVGKVASGFSAVQKSMDMLTGAVQKIPVDKAKELGEKVGQVADKTKNATLMFNQMQAAIGALGVAAGKAFESIGSHVRGIEESLGRAIGGVLKGLGGELRGIGSSQFGGNILSPLIEGARGAVNAVLKSVDHLTQGVLEGVRSVVAGATSLLGDLVKTGLMAAGGVIGAFTPVGPLVGAILGNAVGGLAKAVSDMATGAVNGVASVLSGISAAVSGALQAVVNVAGAILNSLVSIAQGVVEKIGQAFSSLVGKVAGFAGGMVSKVALAITGLAGVAAHQSVKFRDQMAVTFGLVARDGTTSFEKLTSEVRGIMSETPFISWEEGAKGLFQAISFGVREPKARIDALRASIDLALGGGMRELGTAVQGVARMMDQFGVSAREAADRLYTMQNQASLTVSDLSQGIGMVLGSARAAGQTLDEVGAALTFISRALPAEESFTALNRLLIGLVAMDPQGSGGPAAAFREIGVAVRDATGAMRPLSRIMADIQGGLAGKLDHGLLARMREMDNEQLAASLKTSGPAGLALTQMFPNIRMLKAVLPLIAQAQTEYRKAISEQENFAGAAAKAAEEVRKRLGAQLSMTWASWKGLIDKVIVRIEGPMRTALTGLRGYLKQISESEGFDSVGDAVGRALSRTVEFVEKGIRAVVTNWPEISTKAREVWGDVETVVRAAGEAVKAVSTEIRKHLGENPEGKIATAWKGVKEAAEGTWDAVRELSKGNLAPIEGFFESLWGRFKELAGEAWDTVRLKGLEALGAVGDALSNFLDPLGGQLRKAGFSPSGGRSPFGPHAATGIQDPKWQEGPEHRRYKTPTGMEISENELIRMGLAYRDRSGTMPRPGSEGMESLLGYLTNRFDRSRENLSQRFGVGHGVSMAGLGEGGGGLLDSVTGPVGRWAGRAAATEIRGQLTDGLTRFGSLLHSGAEQLEDFTASFREEARLRQELRERTRVERETKEATRQLGLMLRKQMEIIRESVEEARRIHNLRAENLQDLAGKAYSKIQEARLNAATWWVGRTLETKQPQPTGPSAEEVARRAREEAAAQRKGQRVFDQWIRSQREPKVVRTSSQLGLGGPPMGYSIDTVRGRERDVGRLRRTHDELLGGLDEGIRETILGGLPRSYSLRQLRAGIADSKRWPTAPGVLSPEHERELLGNLIPPAPGGGGGGGSAWGPGGGKVAPSQSGPIAGIPEKVERAATAAEGLEDEVDRGATKMQADAERQVKALEAVRASMKELMKAVGEDREAAYKALVEWLQDLEAQIRQVKDSASLVQRRATKARDMAN
jgi:TP901 family phage tail tape measure protein